MRKLALPDDVLKAVDKPARYIGGEFNSINKNIDEIDIRVAMCFPDIYEIGMSNLGIMILYELFNQRSDTWCERVFSPWPDLHRIMKERQLPLFGLESQDPIKDFDFVLISLGYEMAYSNILQIMDLTGVDFWAKNRPDDAPIFIAGGACAYNPEPFAEFFDIVYIGEGETVYDELMDLYKAERASGNYSKRTFLEKACQIPGLYVPAFYEPSYNEDGTIKSFDKLFAGAPDKIERQVVKDMSSGVYPLKPIIPWVKPVQDRMVLEIQRGCIRGCRFCQAGMIYRPNREKDVEVLKAQALELIKNTGQEEMSLSSLSSSDYHALDELLDYLIDTCNENRVNISLPSLRIDAFSLDIMGKVQDVRKSSVTFAPEAGSQRMRNVINKGLTVDDIMNGATMAFKGGWNKVKLYFMLGLPTETEEDMQAIPDLAEDIAMRYYDTIPKEERNGKVQVTISTSFFVPKPFTPLQWARMYEPGEYLRRAKIVNDRMKEELNHKSLRYNWHEADVSVLEGIFARGDRKVAKALVHAYEHGAFFDAWNDYFSYDRWINAFEECGITAEFYAYRERDLDEIFPWDFIDVHVSKDFLKREWNQAMAETVTPNCRQKCSACGSMCVGSGVCYEAKS